VGATCKGWSQAARSYSPCEGLTESRCPVATEEKEVRPHTGAREVTAARVLASACSVSLGPSPCCCPERASGQGWSLALPLPPGSSAAVPLGPMSDTEVG
jgi:hypothetical protein